MIHYVTHMRHAVTTLRIKAHHIHPIDAAHGEMGHAVEIVHAALIVRKVRLKFLDFRCGTGNESKCVNTATP